MKKTMREKALEISNKFPFSPVPLPTDKHGNVIIVKSDLDKNFMKLLEEGKHLDFLTDSSGSSDDMPL